MAALLEVRLIGVELTQLHGPIRLKLTHSGRAARKDDAAQQSNDVEYGGEA